MRFSTTSSPLNSYRHIVKLFGYFFDQENIYIVLEHVNGSSLYALIYTKQHKFNAKEVRRLARQLALAISYLHIRSVIHRDIKPENIIVSEQGDLKLADFGWAAHSPANELRRTFCGTVLYLPPELCDGKGYSKGVDVWSFGVVLYELLFSKEPFRGADQEATMKLIKESELAFPTEMEGLSKATQLIKGCLEKDASVRMTIEEVLAHPYFEETDN